MDINKDDEILIKHISPNEIKITAPLISVDELAIFDNYIHNIVEEYSKLSFEKKDQILTQRIIIKQEKEIEELKNRVHDLLLDNTEYELENERLKNGYCELKVKCNNGECDCTNEEYESMIQANMRGSLLLEDYKSRINKAIEYIEEWQSFPHTNGSTHNELRNLKEILKGENNE